MKGLVAFSCPSCGKRVYATPGAEVGHVCQKVKPRPKFVVFERAAA